MEIVNAIPTDHASSAEIDRRVGACNGHRIVAHESNARKGLEGVRSLTTSGADPSRIPDVVVTSIADGTVSHLSPTLDYGAPVIAILDGEQTRQGVIDRVLDHTDCRLVCAPTGITQLTLDEYDEIVGALHATFIDDKTGETADVPPGGITLKSELFEPATHSDHLPDWVGRGDHVVVADESGSVITSGQLRS